VDLSFHVVLKEQMIGPAKLYSNQISMNAVMKASTTS